MRFTKEGNCFTTISDTAGLAKIADTLSAPRAIGRLSQVCERWIDGCLCLALDFDEQKRSGFQETAEALYLTSGFAYEAPEEAEARFKGEADGFVYSRYGNPTVDMFEERMAALEGAPCARATASESCVPTPRPTCAWRCPISAASIAGSSSRTASGRFWT